MTVLTTEEANKIFDVLVETCNASETLRQPFVVNQTTEVINEWRFGGALGFGGKFWRKPDRIHVNQYAENETPKTRKMIEAANERLAELFAEGIGAE